MYRVDLNCDLGESFGAYSIGNDEAVLECVTSANIACGFHGGDPSVMRRTVSMAVEKGVAIGAHPGYPDLVGFGRRFMDATPGEVEDFVTYQVGALDAFVRSEGARMQHVKAHGALYNAAVRSPELSEAIAEGIKRVDPRLVLYGLAGSELLAGGARVGLPTASETFADRTYQADGTLTSRRDPEALIHDGEQAVAQAVRMVKEGKVRSQQGDDVAVRADTICIHGDGPEALAFARQIRRRLEASEIRVASVRSE
ncbi:MAG: LamB/YcsF family protein [Actinomycetota bacterium]